jgi:hypothetical protein
MTTYAVTSEVFTVATIVRVVVESAELGEWAPEAGTTLLRREGVVTVNLAEVFKGSVAETVGQTAAVPVVLRSSGATRLGDFYALWAPTQVETGSDLVAFVDAVGLPLASALDAAHCVRLTWSAPLVADLRLALGSAVRHLTSDQLLAESERAGNTAGAFFARYVWVAAREALRASTDRFDRLMHVAEDPATRREAREAYLVAAYEDITFTGEFPEVSRARLARAMLRAAADPALGELQGNLLGTYLPNLVTAPLPQPLLPADVLTSHGVEDSESLRDIATAASGLTAWLATGEA